MHGLAFAVHDKPGVHEGTTSTTKHRVAEEVPTILPHGNLAKYARDSTLSGLVLSRMVIVTDETPPFGKRVSGRCLSRRAAVAAPRSTVTSTCNPYLARPSPRRWPHLRVRFNLIAET